MVPRVSAETWGNWGIGVNCHLRRMSACNESYCWMRCVALPNFLTLNDNGHLEIEQGLSGVRCLVVTARLALGGIASTHPMQVMTNLLQRPHITQARTTCPKHTTQISTLIPITTPSPWGEQLHHGTHVRTPLQAQRCPMHVIVTPVQPQAKLPDGSRHKAGPANLAPCLLRLLAKLMAGLPIWLYV
jgi:hypothetical protein